MNLLKIFGIKNNQPTAENDRGVMKLIVGLGNPGPQYAKTRHNVGFQCLDYLAGQHNLSFDKRGMKAVWGKGTLAGQEVALAKPQTFMNLSGQSVGEIVRFYKLDPKQDLLIISDDLDLAIGRMRIRPNGSSGGQNGLKNIFELLGTTDIPRLRIGIGRGQEANARDRVLNNFSREEVPVIQEIFKRTDAAVQVWLTDGIQKAMNVFNAN